MRVSLVHNPKAGDARHSRRDFKALLREFGHDIVHHVGRKDSWKALIRDPGDLIAVAGGDGTVGAVARAFIGRDVPLALLPVGTANNIARTLGLDAAPRELVAGWTDARQRALDIGVAAGPWGEESFIEGFGLGLLATCMRLLHDQDKQAEAAHDDPRFKRLRDELALKALAADFPPAHISGTLDGHDVSGAFLLVQAMNIAAVGPGLVLAPDADPGDGLLDFAFVPEERRAAFIDFLVARIRDEPATAPVDIRRGRTLRIAGCGHDVHIDDRVWRVPVSAADIHPPVEVRVQPQAIRLLVPAETRRLADPPPSGTRQGPDVLMSEGMVPAPR
jgi:diacylglycerol kinase family enzyme